MHQLLGDRCCKLAISMRWVLEACRSFTEKPLFKIVNVAELSSLSFIVTFLPVSCSRKSSNGCPSEYTALAMDMISASVVDLATDDWRREFHAIGQREDPDAKTINMPEVERAL